jgi:hypothetical protein
MTCAWYLLLRNPQTYSRLRTEIDALFPISEVLRELDFYSTASEIQRYFKGVALHYGTASIICSRTQHSNSVDQGVEQYVKFKHKVVGARWQEAQGQWHVGIERPDGSNATEKFDVTINASGILK